MHPESNPAFSIVIPVYNEEKIIAATATQLSQHHIVSSSDPYIVLFETPVVMDSHICSDIQIAMNLVILIGHKSCNAGDVYSTSLSKLN